MKSFENIKSDFPIFERKINGKPLTYLDSGATSQKPNVVLEKMNEFIKYLMQTFIGEHMPFQLKPLWLMKE